MPDPLNATSLGVAYVDRMVTQLKDAREVYELANTDAEVTQALKHVREAAQRLYDQAGRLLDC